MAIKKSDLYSSLWASCDELRGGMDASQYKDYVLFMLFIKYISDKYGNSDAFAPPVIIPKGASFTDMIALKGTRQTDTPRYARMVPLAEIADPKNDYNLNLPRYIDSTEPEDLQDIEGHLRGGIPERDLDALADYWQVLPAVRAALFESAGRAGGRFRPGRGSRNRQLDGCERQLDATPTRKWG